MKVTKMNRAGRLIWVFDAGYVDGCRHVESFPTKKEAESAMTRHQETCSARTTAVAPGAAAEAKFWRREKELMLAVRELRAELARKDEEIAIIHGRAQALPDVPRSLTSVANQLFTLRIPTSSGIYFLCHEGEVIYIGQAVCIMRRVSDHRRERFHEFDAVYWLPCRRENLDTEERRWIHRLLPKGNGRVLPLMPARP